MSPVAKRRIDLVAQPETALAAHQPLAALELLTDQQRAGANERYLLIAPILADVEAGLTRSMAIQRRMALLQTGTGIDQEYLALVRQHGRKGLISRATWNNWMKAYAEQGKAGLAPKYKGSKRKEWGWEARFHYWFDRPSKPAILTVAKWLREDDGFTSATNARVYHYAKSLSSKHGTNSPARAGAALLQSECAALWEFGYHGAAGGVFV